MNLKKILWPETCPFCGKVCADGICGECRKRVDSLQIKEPTCMKCGKPVSASEQEYCHDCAHTHYYYEKGMAMWLHKEPVSTSVYQFKYHNQRFYGKLYAAEIAAEKGAQILRWRPEIIIPVPLHSKRKRKRGYNQAEILSCELGKILEIPVCRKLVKRIRYTEPQKKLGNRMRKRNLEKAFAVTHSMEGVKSVLVVDDIYTTGSTIDAVAKELRKAGVSKVYFLTISIGQGY